ncbi:PIN domain-containing protein [Microbacterium sp. AG157]|uniref:PIN domain-containing protein n=1 Tax=Microbacterium sp. AG157 TaxID=2183993 RepID=UPI0037C7C796
MSSRSVRSIVAPPWTRRSSGWRGSIPTGISTSSAGTGPSGRSRCRSRHRPVQPRRCPPRPGQGSLRPTGGALLHSLTVAETLVVAARVEREGELWDALRSLGGEVAAMGPDEPLLLARLRATHALEMPDTCVLAVAVHLRVPIATFDTRLAAVADEMSLLFSVD